jgi:pyruvate-ferredoxin/flavodoxin oxidoreductase
LYSIAKKNIKFYNVDAAKIANEIGLGKRINMVMTSSFYKLSEVLPLEEALTLLKNDIRRIYKSKGTKIVDMNIKAVDSTLD